MFFRRVIETWFDDEYKEFFYTREPFARFVDMGNITEQLAMKKKMNCKSFDWFMREVAYDVFDKYPKLPPSIPAHLIVITPIIPVNPSTLSCHHHPITFKHEGGVPR